MHEQPTVIADALARYLTPDRKAAAAAAGDRLRRHRPAGARRLRHRALRLPRGEVLVRGAGAAAGRDRGRLRVPLPRAAARPGHARHLRQPVGRDRRHPGRAALRPRAGRPHRLGGQRRDLDHRARERPGAADPRRPRDRRRLHQGLHLPARPCWRRWRSPPAAQRGTLAAAEEERLVAALGSVPGLVAQALAAEPQIAEIARELSARPRRALPRPRPDVPAGARRRAEAEGNQLHPRRRLCVGRAEARPDRPDRRGRAGDRPRPLRRRSSTRPSPTCRR